MRPAVAAFAERMEEVLAANDYKGGWADCDYDYLSRKLGEEFAELCREIPGNSDTGTPFFGRLDAEKRRAITHEAVDLANICMMIADLCADEGDR